MTRRNGRRAAHLGSWAIFSDLSGQVMPNLFNPIITAAAVAVPQEIVGLVRTQVRRRVPTKWKNGGLTGLTASADVIVKHHLRYAVSQLHVADDTKWQTYFKEGTAFHREALDKVGTPMHFLQPDLVLRMELLTRPVASLLGRLLQAVYSETIDEYTVDIEIVADTDLRTQDTEAHFRLAMLQWPRITRVRLILGLYPTVRDTRCETEQAEPLLMLPDYLAGVYQHADPRTVLGQPVVTREEASAGVSELRRRAGTLLFEDSFDFLDVYPLAHDEEGRVVQTRDQKPLA